MDPYFLAIIALIIFSCFFILYLRISAKISKISDSKDALNVSNIKEGDNDSAVYDNVSKSGYPSPDLTKNLHNPDPLSHLKSKGDDFTLLE